MNLMGFREYARHRAVTLQAVQKAIKVGRIRTVGEGQQKKIDADQADRDWAHNTDPAKQSLLHAGARIERAPATDGDDDAEVLEDAESESPDTSDADTRAYRAERAKREAIRREREQLELDQLRGRLVDKQEAARLRHTEFRALRDALGNVGARVKDACAADTDPLACEALIDNEIGECLTAFADQVLTRGVMQDDDDDDEEGIR